MALRGVCAVTAAVIVLAVLLGLATVWGFLAGTAAYGLMRKVDRLEATVDRQRGALTDLAEMVVQFGLDAEDIARWEADQ